ncbi:glucose-dependent insulinotropic receptor-like [Diadema antillarum]|uniref:glucose-dependent insulinotropic receptor-like n=1 Tax=Diadema antillarum TaxID=105358 RepID=UPI003A8C8176
MESINGDGVTSVANSTHSPLSFSHCVSDEEANVVAGIVLVIMILIFTTNVVVIVVIFRSRVLQFTSYVYTLNLAVSDIFVGIMCLLHVAMYFAKVTSVTWCLWETMMYIASCNMSISSIICIAFDRYLAVTRPILYSTRIRLQTGYAKVVVALIWSFSLLYGCLPLFGWRIHNFTPCRHCWFVNVLPKSFVITLFATQFVLPMLIILYLYGSMLSVSFHQANQIADLAESVQSSPRRHSHHRALITLTLIVGCFFLTWAPFFVTLFTHLITGTARIRLIVHTYLFLLAISNSWFNPLVYAYWNREFRKIFSNWFIRDGRKLRHSLTRNRPMSIISISLGVPSGSNN